MDEQHGPSTLVWVFTIPAAFVVAGVVCYMLFQQHNYLQLFRRLEKAKPAPPLRWLGPGVTPPVEEAPTSRVGELHEYGFPCDFSEVLAMASAAAAAAPAQLVGRTEVARVQDPTLLEALQECLATKGEWLGVGRDVRLGGFYTQLQLAAAWRLSSPVADKLYATAQEELSQRLVAVAPPGFPRVDFRTAAQAVKMGLHLREDVNEALLLHGTRAELLGSILANGLNERLSVGLFGNGTYFAEDAGECDQYCTPDEGSQLGATQQVLYPDGSEHQRGVFYILVCSVLLGQAAITQDGLKSSDGGDLWMDSDRTELVAIPGTEPPVLYGALLIEPGQRVARYREVIVFRRGQVVPRFLIAYRRRR